MTFSRHLLLPPLLLLSLCACSRTVTWREEVPLNTGETIVVRREGTYSWQQAAGNPLVWGYRRDPRTSISFEYKGRRYSYTGEASLQALAISPAGVPTLVVFAADIAGSHFRVVEPAFQYEQCKRN